MIAPDVRAEVRRLYFAEHWKVGTIAAQLNLHHDTVRAALEMGARPAVVRPTALDPYLDFVRKTLHEYPRLRATRLHEMLRLRGFSGSVVQLRRAVRCLRPTSKAEAYLRVNLFPGEQAQADWGHFGRIQIGNTTRPLYAFVMVLSWSRALHAVFTLDQTGESFLRGHVEAFSFFAGVPRQVAYDNLKSAVLERRGAAIRFHPRLLDFAGHYHYAPHPCTPARGNEKGRVERQIHFLRYSFFDARPFRDLDDLNAQFVRWRDGIAHARPHPERPDLTVAQALAEEQPRLIPLPEHPFDTDLVRTVSTTKSPYVHFDRNSYSIPHDRLRKPLTLVASATTVRLLDGLDEIARHTRSWEAKRAIEDPRHVQALVQAKKTTRPEPLRDLLARTVPAAQTLFERLASRGDNLHSHLARLRTLLDDYGPQELQLAIQHALDTGALSAASVAHILDQRRRAQHRKPPIPLALPKRPGVDDLDVTPHKLEPYDALARTPKDTDDSDPHDH